MNVLAQVGGNKETRVALAATLGIVTSTLTIIYLVTENMKQYYTKCGRLSGQWRA